MRQKDIDPEYTEPNIKNISVCIFLVIELLIVVFIVLNYFKK